MVLSWARSSSSMPRLKHGAPEGFRQVHAVACSGSNLTSICLYCRLNIPSITLKSTGAFMICFPFFQGVLKQTRVFMVLSGDYTPKYTVAKPPIPMSYSIVIGVRPGGYRRFFPAPLREFPIEPVEHS